MQLGDLPIPAMDRITGYTPEFHLFWRRNLDSFLTFVRRQVIVPKAFAVRVQDTSLRAITNVRVVDWRGPHSQWAVIDIVPLNREFPAMPPPPPQVAPRRISARATRGRAQSSAPAEPSQPSSSQAPAAEEARRHKRLRTQRERDANTFVAFKLEAEAAARPAGQAAGEMAGTDVPVVQTKRCCLETVVESDNEGERDMDANIGDDADDDNNDDDDNLPLSVQLETLRAQSSMLAGGLAAEDITVVAISDSPEEREK
ncbi:hypothetical protein RHMOL_Rhmol01G0219900 [Rhododendron molle]|uniref:Uncharacterized protein n=1 Tax=Rhododendron molle TaxID=49168 RepID=A0ACC0Q4P7_RHOML|nr:hypothetical protein RHMOL_Rhmol01G0219900 [Rhododendron molle]